MRFRLCDQDRERFGAPEVCEFDLRNITIGEMDELSTRFGFDVDDWPDPFTGTLTLDQAGDPNAVPKPPPWRNQALMWMLLRQNGCDASWDDAAHTHPMLTTPVPDEQVEAGKDSPDSEPSPSSGTSTTRRSRTSTGSRKKT